MLIVILLVSVGLSGARQANAAACTVTLSPGDNIQTAIDNANPGDVICLSAGVYAPGSRIDITESVTLQGPQFGVDPRAAAGLRTAGGAGEAIIDGSGTLAIILRILADNVIVDGLEIRNGTGDLIESQTATPTTGTIVRYNFVHDSTGDEGMQLRATTNGRIQYNHVYNTAGDGINMCCNSTNGRIEFNEVRNSSSPDGMIYVYSTTHMVIDNNYVHDGTGNDGIKMGDTSADSPNPGGSITNNLVERVAQDGINLYMSDTTIQCNRVYGSQSQNGAVYIYYDVTNVEVLQNDIRNNGTAGGSVTYGVRIGQLNRYPSITAFSQNNIAGNEAGLFYNYDDEDLLAENNWWGAADGPSGEGPGSGDSITTSTNPTSHVDFDPWAAAEFDLDALCGRTLPPQPPDDDDDDDDDGGGGAAGPAPVDHGQIAMTFDCADLGLQTGGAMTASGTSGNVAANGQVGNTFCHVIALNGEYVTHPGEIGKPEVIGQGVVQAVDLFGLLPGGVPVKPFVTPVGLCMAGRGSVYFLNAEDRAVSQLPASASGSSTCVTVPASGTVVLAGTYTPGPAVTSAAPAANGVATPLTGCQVTTEYMLRLRQDASTSSTILDRVPVGTTLAATERLNGWFHVIYGSQQGWLSGDYVTTSGSCG